MSLGKWLTHWTAHLVAGLLITTPLTIEAAWWVPFLSVPLAALLLSFSSPWWAPVAAASVALVLAALQSFGPDVLWLNVVIPFVMVPTLAVLGVLRELWQNDWLEGMNPHRWLEAMGWPIGATAISLLSLAWLL